MLEVVGSLTIHQVKHQNGTCRRAIGPWSTIFIPVVLEDYGMLLDDAHCGAFAHPHAPDCRALKVEEAIESTHYQTGRRSQARRISVAAAVAEAAARMFRPPKIRTIMSDFQRHRGFNGGKLQQAMTTQRNFMSIERVSTAVRCSPEEHVKNSETLAPPAKVLAAPPPALL